MAELKPVFPGLGRKLRPLVGLHLELIGCLSAGTEKKRSRVLQSDEFLALVTRQGESVARLTAFCEGLTSAEAEVTHAEAYEESDWSPLSTLAGPPKA
jgi:hypothetical protein